LTRELVFAEILPESAAKAALTPYLPDKGSEGVGGHFGNWRLIAQIVWMFKPEKFKSFVIKQDAEKMLRVDYSSR